MPVQNEEQNSTFRRTPKKTIKGSIIFGLVHNAYVEGKNKCQISKILATNLDVSSQKITAYLNSMGFRLKDMVNSKKSGEDFLQSYENYFSDMHIYQDHYSNTFKYNFDLLKEYHNQKTEGSKLKDNHNQKTESYKIDKFFNKNNSKYSTFRDVQMKHFGYDDVGAMKEVNEQELINKWGAVFTDLKLHKFTSGLSALFEKYRSVDVLTVDMQREFFVYLKKQFPGDPVVAPSGTKRKPIRKTPDAKRLNIDNPIAPSASSSTFLADDQGIRARQRFIFVEQNDVAREQVHPFFANPMKNNNPSPRQSQMDTPILPQSESAPTRIGLQFNANQQTHGYARPFNYSYHHHTQQSFLGVGNVIPLQPSMESKFLSFQLPKNNNTMPNNNPLFQHSLFNVRTNVRPPQPDTQFAKNNLEPWRFGQ